MAAHCVDITKEQSPTRGFDKTVEIAGENTIVRLAVQELEKFFCNQIQKIKTLLEDGVVADKISDGVVNKIWIGRGRLERNYIKELELPPQKYYGQGHNDVLHDHICPTCGNSTQLRQILTIDSRLAASDQVFDESFLFNHVQKASNQQGVKQSFHPTVSFNEILLEEKLSGTDKYSSTSTNPRKTSFRKKPRKKRGFGMLSLKKRQDENQGVSAKLWRDWRQKQLLWGKKAENHGQTEEADQKEKSEFFDHSPLLRAANEQQHWSDALGDSSYSGESVSLMEISTKELLIGVHGRSNSGSEDTNQGILFSRDREARTNSWSSSSSLLEYRGHDFFTIDSSRPPQLERERGRLTQRQRFETSSRSLEREQALRPRVNSQQSGLLPVPTARGRSGRMPRISLGFRSLSRSQKIRKGNITDTPGLEISDAENSSLSPRSNSIISIFTDINGI